MQESFTRFVSRPRFDWGSRTDNLVADHVLDDLEAADMPLIFRDGENREQKDADDDAQYAYQPT